MGDAAAAAIAAETPVVPNADATWAAAAAAAPPTVAPPAATFWALGLVTAVGFTEEPGAGGAARSLELVDSKGKLCSRERKKEQIDKKQ